MLKSLIKLFSHQKPHEPEVGIEEIGNASPVCPYCSIELEKMPGRKKKCPGCENFILVRTSPITGNKVLIKDSQISDIEEAWAIKNGAHQEYINNKDKEERRIKHMKNQDNSSSRKSNEGDANWSFLNSELEYYAKASDWVGYRNTRLEMAEQLLNEKKYKNSLVSFLEVAYRELASPEELISSDVYDGIIEIKKATKMKQEDIKEVWDTYVTRVTLTLPHDKAWEEISELINIGS